MEFEDPNKWSDQVINNALNAHEGKENLVTGKVGVAEQSPMDVYHILIESDTRNNIYTNGYRALCGTLRDSSTLILDATKAELTGYKFCSRCRKKKLKMIWIERALSED